MTVFPSQIDTDVELPRVSDDLSDLSADHINAIRDALFAIEKEIGIDVSGSLDSLADFLAVSLNSNGTIKASALLAVGLLVGPIINSQVASNAGIAETKLNLDYSTTDLYTKITTNAAILTSIVSLTTKLIADLKVHLTGSTYFTNSSDKARHVGSQIDLNPITADERDISYSYTGLKNKSGVVRSATHVMDALLQINNDLINHQNATAVGEHYASAISVNVENFNEIPKEANDLQKVVDYLDDNETLNIGQHRATQHANAIPKIARTNAFDETLGVNVIPSTSVITYLVTSPNVSPVDSLSNGDDLVRFVTSNTNFAFDAKFSQVKIGDIITINYGNGIESSYLIDSIRYSPGVEYVVRINGTNKVDSTTATARIDRPSFNDNTYNVFAVSAANIRNYTAPIYTEILSSLIVSDPKAACVLGLGFDAGQINSDHYKLYLELYPTGNPADKTIKLPAVDVSGNAGATPGKYTIESLVQTANDKLREIGYNYRFIAFSYKGEFGIGLADSINGASFAIISGDNSSGTLATGSYTENVIGGSSLDNFDCFGFGTSGINLASPAYQATWNDSTGAQSPTKVISPLKHKYAHINGNKLDSFVSTYLTNSDGYWDGYISAVNPIANSNVEVTYTVLLDLCSAGLKPGKTIIIQPKIEFSDPLYNDIDYGRFFIKSVNFSEDCGLGSIGKTDITVVNGVHALGTSGYSPNTAQPQLNVKIYFSCDSVGFDDQNIIDSSSTSNDYSRFYEIYLDDAGKTFSHERARMLRQTETTTLLASTNWHIIDVSPKLRGYVGIDPLIFNKYIRFFATNYNSTTGEYDGYVGQLSGSTITKIGPTITGRKNIVTRFYDETNVDYVDLIFVDNSTSPGLNVLSSSLGRYVDIELFPTLELHDELFLLAVCEINWNAASGENIVQYVKDKRQFGSVDEFDFTDSAKDYISASDKYLHANGIFRGFEFDSISSVADSGEIFFKGGIALVNGKFVSVNNGSVTIPRVYPTGSSLPQTVTWMVCVNELGNFVPILLTDSKEQYFATPNSGNYYLPSVSFFELTTVRKDLVPIRLITSVVGSLVVSDLSDVRRFISSQDSLAPITLTSSNKIIGNFNSIAALKQWINRSDGYEQFVKIKGNFVQATTDSSYNLTGFEKKVIFEGEGSIFTLNATKGILIGSNVTLRDFTFNYSGSESYGSTADLLNVGNGSACVVNTLNESIANVSIENCIFNYTANTQRPPFILFQFNKGNEGKNISIKNCSFNDVGTTDVKKSQAAIAFYTFNSGASTDPALLYNCEIVGNICNQKQSIYVTTSAAASGVEEPGIVCINCRIEKNICGIIGYLISGTLTASETLTDSQSHYSLDIIENNCSVIASLYGKGTYNIYSSVLTPSYATSNVLIKNNKANWISILANDISASFEYSSLNIDGNVLVASDDTYLSLFSLALANNAITVATYLSDTSSVSVVNNTMLPGRIDSTTYDYTRGIRCQNTNSIIKGNVIRSLETDGIGIYLVAGGSVNKCFTVEDNQIFRGSNSISAYIYFSMSSSRGFGTVKNNYFDSSTIDGSSETLFDGTLDQFVIESNINQTATFRGSLYNGKFATGSATPLIFGDSTLSATYALTGLGVYDGGTDHNCQIIYDTSISADRFIYWAIQLDEIVPKNAYITEVSMTMASTITFTTSTMTLSLMGTTLTTLTQSGAPTTITNAGQTLTVTPANNDYVVNNTIRPVVKLNGTLKVTSGGSILNITSFTIKYRW